MGYILDQKLWPSSRWQELQLWYDSTSPDTQPWAERFQKIGESNKKRIEYLDLVQQTFGPVLLLAGIMSFMIAWSWVAPVAVVVLMVASHFALAWWWKRSVIRRSLALPKAMLALQAKGVVMRIGPEGGPYGMLLKALVSQGEGETTLLVGPADLLAKHFVPFAALWWRAQHTEPALQAQLPQRAQEAVRQFLQDKYMPG